MFVSRRRSMQISESSAAMTERIDSEHEKQECWVLLSRAERVLLILLIVTIVLLVAACIVIGYLFITAQHVCETPSCIKASAELLEMTDPLEDPCDDFYSFICGNYAPPSEECEEANHLRRKAVASVLTGESDSDSLMIAKQFFDTCIEDVEENSNETLLAVIKTLRGWPLLLGQKWNDTGFHWLNFMSTLRSQGFKYDWFIGFDYYEDTEGKNFLLIVPPDLKQLSSKYTNSDYLEGMVSVCAKLGSSSTSAWKEMQKVLEFEHELINISMIARRELSNKDHDSNVQQTVKILNGLWPEIKLEDILNDLTGGYASFTNSTTIVTAGNYYIFELNLLLRRTPKRTQANYIIWKVLESFLPFSSENFRQSYGKYNDLPSREDYCLTETIRRFYSGLQMYVSTKEKNEEIKQSVVLMSELIKKQIGEKAEGLKTEVVGIDNPRITESLGITEMINEVNKWNDNAFYNCLHKKSTICSEEGYLRDPRHLEIHYDISKNRIDIPFVLLHSDWYRWDQPNYINYARLGRTLGDVFIEAIKERNETLDDEEISGVALAYGSYVQWVRDAGKEKRLPAISYSTRQLFWMHSSSMYCLSSNDSVKFDEVTNSSYFSQDFNCDNEFHVL